MAASPIAWIAREERYREKLATPDVTIADLIGDISFDPDALRDKYREERDKRLRPDANDQYVQIEGNFDHYLDDPYTARVERAPKTDHVTVAVIGGGVTGLAAARAIREAEMIEQRFCPADLEIVSVGRLNRQTKHVGTERNYLRGTRQQDVVR